MKSLLFILSLSVFSLKAHSQTIDPKIREVYASQAEAFVAQNPDWLKVMNDYIQNRVKVITVPLDNGHEKYVKLSEVKLLNKYNPDLQRDAVFDPATFNPVKYEFAFSAQTRQVYRVDNTDYVIVIEPQSFK